MVPLSGISGLTQAQVASKLRKIASEFYFSQADSCAAGGAYFAAFIVLTSAIQYSAGLAIGIGPVNGPQFKAFCSTYLTAYDADSLWLSMRCGFFHRGAPQIPGTGGRAMTARPVWITHGRAMSHDPSGSIGVTSGKVTINYEDFRKDVETAFNSMLACSVTNGTLLANLRSGLQAASPGSVRGKSNPILGKVRTFWTCFKFLFTRK